MNATAETSSNLKERVRYADFVSLMKLRLNSLVLGAVAAGYVLGKSGQISLSDLGLLLLGVTLTGGGSSAINMGLEGARDRRMERTKNRPVASGRVLPLDAILFGSATCALGLLIIFLSNTPLAGLLTLLTILLYVLVYTPLKPRTHLNTWVGAVPGAIPPLIGWAAATGTLTPVSLSLFGIVFFWQFPHFFAIASVYRDDYARGGFAMLPVLDPSGLRTAHQVMMTSLAMLPVSLLPTLFRLAGSYYFVGALILSSLYLLFSLRASLLRQTDAWRDLLRVSLLVLPGLFVLLIADRLNS
ncbi:MAG TPA: heme o synthase [Planctomycetota bacterium]|nr:heme o synthase [Planctomycetota bacterium]